MFLGGLTPAIGIIGGGELGGDGVRKGETGTEPPGGEGNNRGFREKASGLEGIEVSLSVKETTVIGGGVVKLGEGKSTGKLPKFKLLEAPTDGVIGK
jgi:hypothetical protein